MLDLEEAILRYLLSALQSEDPLERQEATQRLWERWFSAKGEEACQTLLRIGQLIERRQLLWAEEKLTQLIRKFPDFAEAYNQRAIARYLMEQWEEAVEDCQRVIALNPHHFGAFHGLGICYMATEDYRLALTALQQALAIQPFALINRQLIAECLNHLEGRDVP
jgi:tetratricopeptide (TPR) repeat protein